MQDYKNNKILELKKEMVKVPAQTDYEINGVDTSRAIYFYRKEKEKFKIIPRGSYTIVDEASNKYLRITDSILLEEAIEFQVCYLFVKTSSSYIDDFPEIVLLQEHYNQLYEDFNNLLQQLQSNNILGDTLKMSYVLPQLNEGQVWVLRQGEMVAENIFDLDARLQEVLEQFKILFSKWVDNTEKPRIDAYVDEKIQIANDEINSKTELEKIELEDYTEQKKNELDIYASGRKPIQYGTIAELRASNNLKINDFVEVAGYYAVGDGAGHKRVISQTDDGSGVQLTNNLWANIVHNGEINVGWFGAKGDGVTDDTSAIQKAIDFSEKTIFNTDKTYLITETINVKYCTDFSYCKILKNTVGFAFAFNLNVKFFKNLNFDGMGIASCLDMFTNASHYDLIENVFIVNAKTAIDVGRYSWCKNFRNIKINKCGDVSTRALNIEPSKPVVAQDGTNYISIDGLSIEECVGESFIDVWGCVLTHIHVESNTVKRALTIKGKAITLNGGYFESRRNGENEVYFNSDSTSVNGVLINCNIYNESNYTIQLNACSVITTQFISEKMSGFTFNGCEIQRVSSDFSKPSKLNNGSTNVVFRKEFCTNNTTSDSLFYGGNSTYEIINVSDSLNKRVLKRTITNSVAWGGGFAYKIPDFLIGKNVFVTLIVKSPNRNVLVYTKENWEDVADASFCKATNTFTVFTAKILVESNFLKIRTSGGEVGEVLHIDSVHVSLDGTCYDSYTVINAFKQLDTPYYTEKMKQEGVYNDFISYMDEKVAYDNQQREKEKAMQLAYEEALKENPSLTYEEFISTRPATFSRRKRSIEIQEPVPSQALLEFKEKYLG